MIRRPLLPLLLVALVVAVGLARPASAAQPEPLLTLDAPASASTGDTVALSAYLTDPAGNPVPGQEIVFSYTDTFLNTEGSVLLGTAVTDETGLALFEYVPTSEGALPLAASFAGNQVFAEANATATLTVAPGAAVYEEPTPFRIPGANVGLVVAILVVVWGTFLFVTVLFWLIAKAGSAAAGKAER